MKVLDNTLKLCYTAYGYLKQKEGKKMKKVSKVQAKSQVSKVSSWAIVSALSAVILGFATQGVIKYINGMSEQQKLLAAIFVVSLISYVIYVNLKKVIK